MLSVLGALDPDELVLIVIAVLGLLPVLNASRSKLLLTAYLLLCVAIVATNLESLLLPDLLNGVEHAVGLLGSGLAFLAVGYAKRRALTADGDDDADGGAAVDFDGAAGRLRTLAGGK
jgi:hypothetical protein